MNNLGDGMDTLPKFADDIKVRERASPLDGRIQIPHHFDKLEIQSEMSKMKLNKVKCCL